MYQKVIIFLSVLVLPCSVIAAEDKPASKWGGEAELGYLKTTGNTETESLHFKGKIVNERKKWKHTATLEVTDKSDRDIQTAKRWYVTGKSDYSLNDVSYLFISLTYEDDRFSGYDYQATGTFGYGHHVIKREDMKLDLEAGVGTRQSKLVTGESNSEGIVKGALDFDWKLSNSSTFLQFLSVEAGEDNTISRSVTALKMQIIGRLAAKLSYTVKHSTDVPPGVEKTDTESVITLVYDF